MKGAFFLGDRRVEIREIPKPDPGPEEVLIEMKASGICGTDIKMGYVSPYAKPSAQVTEEQRKIVCGHEPCGVVAKLGPCTRNVKVGDRVIVYHYLGCGKCKYCLTGWTHMCAQGARTMGFRAPGGHEDFLICPDKACVHLPDEMSFEEGACCACGTGTAYQALKRLAPSGMDTLAVFGQGPVGASATMLAKAMGARVIAVDIVPERLELARRLGADEIVNAREVNPVEAIKELTKGEMADATLECTAVEEVRLNTIKSTKIWGRACLVGGGGTVTFEVTPMIIRRQMSIYGSWTFSAYVLAEAAKFIVDHKVPLKDLVTHTFPLAKAGEAYKLFETGKTGKVVIAW